MSQMIKRVGRKTVKEMSSLELKLHVRRSVLKWVQDRSGGWKQMGVECVQFVRGDDRSLESGEDWGFAFGSCGEITGVDFEELGGKHNLVKILVTPVMTFETARLLIEKAVDQVAGR